eukprot:GHUV01024291.1.p2 GENE.GHUV01024291.1~~GHUV01024291.1.p2  ORF type:complete len:103 (+),score=15.69 GHUV01024291.1:1010-1318(+)
MLPNIRLQADCLAAATQWPYIPLWRRATQELPHTLVATLALALLATCFADCTAGTPEEPLLLRTQFLLPTLKGSEVKNTMQEWVLLQVDLYSMGQAGRHHNM